jgi:site-specific recombinase XerD
MYINTLCERLCEDATIFRGYAPDTIQRYRIATRLFQRSMGAQLITECTPQVVREFFYRGRADRHWSSQTFVTYHKSLNVFFKWCIEQGHLRSNPLEGVEVPRLEKALPRRLPEDQARLLLEKVLNYSWGSEFERRRNHALLATVIWAGLRRKELLRLELSDFDLGQQTLFVRRGKGAKDRMVPMSATYVAIMQRYLDERGRSRKTCQAVFPSLVRDAGLTLEGLRHLVLSLREVSGIRFRLHALRHTFATLMIEGGCEIYALSQMMGHDKITTTTGYLAASPEHLRAQIAKHPLNSSKARRIL